MATTQYKDNAGNVYEFQQESGDAGGAEKRPVAGMPAAVRTQLTDMTSALLALAGTVLAGSLKVVLQASNVVIGKLAPNAGVNIGTVDVNSGTFSVSGSLPVGSNHIGAVAVDAALPAGNNNIGDVDVLTLPALAQLPATLGAKPSAASLSVVLAGDQGAHPVSLSAPIPAGTNNIGDVDIASMPPLPAGSNAIGKLAPNVGVNIGTVDVNNAIQLPATLGQKVKATSLAVTMASDQPALAVTDGGAPLMVIGNGGNPLPVTGTVTVGNNVVVSVGTSLPAGSANIGDVDIASMPPLPAGTNAIGKLAANAGVNIGTVGLAAGTTNIGDVDVLTLPALPQLPVGLGQLPVSGSLSVTLASDSDPVIVTSADIGLDATVNTISASTTVVTLASSNPNRVGLIVVNNKTSTSTLYLKFGTGASLTSWSVLIEPGGYWEMPRRYWTGTVTGIWSTAVGDAHVTETDNYIVP
jgi:hypothetical protein